MSTENYGGCTFRYVKDGESSGKLKVYVERGASSQSKHIYKGKNGSPPYICFKPGSKPSSAAEASRLARKWADNHS